MNKFLVVLSLFCLGINAIAQDLRPWSAGPLQWSEFRGDGSFQEQNALSVITWEETTGKTREGYIRYYYPVLQAVFNPTYSFIKEGSATPEELARQQYHFDLKEYFARAFRDSLMHGVADLDATRSLFDHRCQEAFEKSTVSPEELHAALQNDTYDPKALRWKEANSFRFDIGYAARWIPVTPDKYSPVCDYLTFRVGYIRNRFSASFELNLLSIASMIIGLQKPLTLYRAQSVLFGYDILQKNRFYLTALAGGGIGRYMMLRSEDPASILNKTYESGFATEAIQAEYTVASYCTLQKGKPERTDVRLFTRLGADQMFVSDGIIPSFHLHFGINFSVIRLKLQ